MWKLKGRGIFLTQDVGMVSLYAHDQTFWAGSDNELQSSLCGLNMNI
jgi:hypothetical protein